VDLDTELAAPPGEGGRHPLPDPEVVEAALRRCGVSEGTRVVVYDGKESYAAGRAWWVFRWVGLSDVRVLDGGFAAWQAAGLPVSTEEPEEHHGDFVARPGSLPTVDAESAAHLARSGLLLDARAAERYAGEVEPIDPVAGHIPGAVSAPTASWLADDGTFRKDLSEHWAALKSSFDRDGGGVGVYCGSGVTAAHTVLALAEIGVDAALYPGSWSEWIRDPGRPVATGSTP
jgi:thiosulfate/3-mercaptopyruvate sulfurtransferase